MSVQRIQLGPFFDQGALCGAALLEHYEAGTSTLKQIWSDSAKSTTLAQPFISDANGVFNFFGDGTYKLIIKKSDGTVLHTLDQWSIASSAEAAGLTIGATIPTSSSMTLGDATWAHWSGSTNVSTLSGTALFYWAIADGSFTLLHSAALVLPDARNRKVNAGDALLFLRESSGLYRLASHLEKEGGWKGRKGASVAASSTLSIPTDGDFIDVSGGTTITAVATAQAGYRFRARFTGTGLNITHNTTSLGSPWGYDYHTIQNEVIEFQSLGSGNWMFYSLNGPSDRIGKTIEWNGSSDPPGYLEEVGGTFSSATYPGLFAFLGSTNIPDRRGRTGIGVDGAAGRVTSASTGGGAADTLLGTGGAQTHTLVLSETPSHTHTDDSTGNQTVGAGGIPANSYSGGAQTGSAGGDGAHNNMPPWIAKRYFIRF